MSRRRLTEEERKQKEIDELNHQRKYEALMLEHEMEHRIINGSSENMKEIEDNTVDLIVTSPPYYNAKEYSTFDDLDDYYENMRKIFKESYRVLKEGRRFCLNISDIPVRGKSGIKWLALGPGLLRVAEELGFELADRVFWFKTPLKGFQYGSLPYPPSPLIADSMEYIYILRKPLTKKPDYTYVPKDFKEASKLTREEYGTYTQQVWSIRRVRLNDNIDGHIAPFPEELPMRLIKLYSFSGDLVLDPFAGSGTTGIAAMKARRNSIQYELLPKYAEMIEENMKSEKNLFIKDKITLIK